MRRPRKLYDTVADASAKTRPVRADWWDDDAPVLAGTTVEKPEERWEPTGLLDQDGRPIMRYSPGMDPIGFLWHDREGSLRPRDDVIAELETEE